MLITSPMVRIDTTDAPFLTPVEIVIDLPMPPSVNRIWRARRAGKARVSISPEYDQWKRHADRLAIATGACRGVKKIMGKFEAQIVLQRQRGDLDNRVKGVLDWAQSRELTHDDQNCERLVVEWGEAPHGCRLTIRPVALVWVSP